MPLNKDPEGGGSNEDGSRSGLYCSLCYSNGAFIHPDFDAQQMQEFCMVQLKNKGMPGFMAWLFTRGIPKLQRWQPN